MKRKKQSYMDEHIEGVVVCETARTRNSTVLPTEDLREVPRLSWAVRRIYPQAVRGRQSCPRNTLHKSSLQSAVTVMAVEYASLHPYHPVDAHINGYVANETPVLRVLATASAGCTIILGTVLAAVSYTRPALSKADRLAILWFFISGSLHCFFEGYFVLNHGHMASAQDIFGQLWKEYALSDSRYLTSDTLVLCMETMTTLVWGPLCFSVAYLIFVEHSLRYPIQIIVCLSHLYGDTLYYATSLFDHYVNGVSYCRPEAYYFWVYYFLMNFIWIVVPMYYLYTGVTTISGIIQSQREIASRQKSR
ncbi:hypothetical protein MPDQ_002924 [Monascus purpureus]|uniref:EXPERA domain-containing protein n=1 Tax=Monascus purpureus TaxID=5098 RepID=A0A507QM21_MONPU|nr:hypothetical protein MPDQ_002924 [Monascus purpureus]BDD57258.1 hypothetical protein MAP00_002641 [Monascus purpureus]